MSAPSMRRARLVAAALVSAVFAAGAAAGVAIERNASSGRIIKTRIGDDLPRLYDRLALTPEQRVIVDSMAARRAPRTEALMREFGDRLHAVSDSLDGELREVLTGSQRALLDSVRQGQMLLLKRKVGGRTTVDTVARRRMSR